MPTAYSPGLQRLSELPGFTLVQGPCVVPGGLAVDGRPSSCASTTELDAIMTMAKAALFVCGFTPAPLPLAISPHLPAKLSGPMLTKQMIQAYFDTNPCLRLCKSGRFIESPRWVVCHEHRRSKRPCATVREMKEDPSRPAVRCRPQTAASCCRQKRWW